MSDFENKPDASSQSGIYNAQPQAEPQQQASFGSADWQWQPASVPEEPKKEKKKGGFGRFLLACLAVLLAAGICFGAGYAGILTAANQKNKVVIRQIMPGEASGDDAPAALPAGAMTGVQIAEAVENSVVAITTEIMTTGSYWFGNYVTSGAGSGVIISEDGYILTCAHVINGATKVAVELRDGGKYEAEVVGKYVDGDIAVIKIDAQGLTPAVIADSDAVKQGSVCYAVGNPEGRFSGSISDGIVSALDRKISVQVEEAPRPSTGNSLYDMFYGGFSAARSITLNVIQMTAAVSPGNSGGALFNDHGQLIGIVSAKSSNNNSEGLGFAIPSNTAMDIASQLISSGTYEADPAESDSQSGVTPTANKAVLGITVTTVTAENSAQYNHLAPGIYVSSITAESTEQAGLAVGDRLISVDDVLVSAAEDVTGYLAGKNPGDTVSLNVERSGKLVSVTVTLVENTAN